MNSREDEDDQGRRDRGISEQPAAESEWSNRQDLMSEQEVTRLSADKGKGKRGASIADQKSEPGANAQDPTKEGGMAGNKQGMTAENNEEKPEVSGESWTKYDWS